MSTATTVSENLRVLADLIEAHPDLPPPYVTAGAYGTDASWYLHINDLARDLPEQKAVAARVVSTLGGKWAKSEDGERYRFSQTRTDGLGLNVTVNRAAVCERVVTGSHEVTVPAMDARPAEPGRVETVEDVTWVCSSLLAEPVSAPKPEPARDDLQAIIDAETYRFEHSGAGSWRS